MATTSSMANGHSEINGSNGELTAAQKLMLKHAENETHKATIEDVPDEEDVKHGEPPKSTSVLEDADDSLSAPQWAQPMSSKSAGKQKEMPVQSSKPSLDTQSHELFPELGGAPKAQSGPAVAPTWGAKTASTADGGSINGATKDSPNASGVATPTSSTPRTGPTMAIPGQHREQVKLAPNQMIPRKEMKKPLADIVKEVDKKSKAKVSFSAGPEGVFFFNAVGPFDACRNAIRDIVAQVGSKQSVKVHVARAARAQIIGKQGVMIKAIQERTGARIQMPKDNGVEDENDDGTVAIQIDGNALSCEMARIEINKIAGDKVANVNHPLRGLPAEFYPFIAGPNNQRVQTIEEANNVRIRVPSHHTWSTQAPPQPTTSGVPLAFQSSAHDNPITLAGEHDAVQAARAAILAHAEELKRELTAEQIAINRGRHQFIIGNRGIPADQFLSETGCAIILPADPEDQTITILGPSAQLQIGVERAMDLAASMQSSNIDISRQHRNAPNGAAVHAQNVTRYLQQRAEIARLEKLYNAHIVTPIVADGSAPWELYSRDGRNAIRAQSEITSIVNGHPPSRMANIAVDPFFYSHMRKDISPKVRDSYGVYTVIPDDADASSQVLLVFEGPTGTEPEYQLPRTQPSAAEAKAFQKGLEDARKHILELISKQEQIVSESIDVPQKFHEKLRKFIKKEQQERSKDQIPARVSATGTIVTLRGPSSGVESLANKVKAFVEQETEDEKERGFTMSFDFPQKHANQLIGKGGSNITALRERFDVEIQVKDGKVDLKGPKAKAEAAKAHINTLGKHWADEATHTLKIDPKFHRELIGAQGNQINKLQTRYKVQIHFPKSARPAKDDQSPTDGASDSGAKPRRIQAEDEVIVRGPSKGADEARDEILSLLQYLRDNSHSATVTVQQTQVPSLIGQGGKGMDELRQITGAKIDVPGSRDTKDPSGLVEIQIKGTKAQVTAAKKLIEEKKSVFDQTVIKTLDVDKKHHKALIGAGGATLKEIVVKAGGSDDRRELARTVQFPRAEADGNHVKIEGKQDVVEKIIAAFQEIVLERENQVSEIVEVPTEKHRSLIGRGGETKKSLESKFMVTIDIPRQGSSQTGVKISGRPDGVEKAKAHILDLVKDEAGETVQVPKSVHHTVSDNGQFFRKLKNDHKVTVDHGGHKVPAKPAPPSNTRGTGGALPLITDDQDTSSDAFSWNVVKVSSDLDGEIPWILRGPPENVAKAKSLINAAVEQAQKATATGYLVLPDPKTYRYIIGQGGSKVNSIRKATGCKINVPRDQAKDEAVEISGSAEGVEKAKDMILEAVKEGIAVNGRS